MLVFVPGLHQNNAACSGFAEQFGRIKQLAGKFAGAPFFRYRQLAKYSAAPAGDGPHPAGYRLRYDPAIGDTMRVNAPDPEFPLGPNFLAGIDLWSTWAEIR